MLIDLWVKDIVLVQEISFSPSEALSVLTGETGAGKSVLLNSLSLALGERAESRLVRKGSPYGEVVAQFSLPENHHVIHQLKQDDLWDDDEPFLQIRRKLSADGGSKAWLNSRPISLSFLRSIMKQIIEIHGQFESQKLLDISKHQNYLDNYGHHQEDVKKLSIFYEQWKEQQRLLEEIQKSIEEKKAEEELLRHSVQELESGHFQKGEEDQLLEERRLLKSSKELMDFLQSTYRSLEGEAGILSISYDINRQLDRLSSKMGSLFDDLAENVEALSQKADDVLVELQNISNQLNFNPMGLEEIEERLYFIRSMSRKYHVLADDLPELLEEKNEALYLLDHQDLELKNRQQALEQARSDYINQAQILSDQRRKTAKKLDEALNQELIPLHLQHAYFCTKIEENPESHWSAKGVDHIEFQVSTHKNASADTISKVASGGELSRITLALRIILARSDDLLCLVLDEADTGISGKTAAAFGERLSHLSQDIQLLVITHSPQVASQGHSHFLVEKTEQEGEFITSLRLLELEERRDAIASMISGTQLTDEAKAAAEKLLIQKK